MSTEPLAPDSDTSTTYKWDFIVARSLQRQQPGFDKWVQMHMIDRFYGGNNDTDNLIPAPNSVNCGHFRSFETTVFNLMNGLATTAGEDTMIM